jgi:pentatricopeptide repeat protein
LQTPHARSAAPPLSGDRTVAERGRAFVGREPELEILLAGLREAQSGRGKVFLIAGEPGIGKSRLADEFSVRAKEEGAFTLWGRCWEAGGAPAYWPWIQSLRGLARDLEPEDLRTRVSGVLAQLLLQVEEGVPELVASSSASPEAARFRLFDALTGLLRKASEEGPLVLVLEDIHAADAPSLLLLQFMAGEIAMSRALVVATYRDTEPARDQPLGTALAELARIHGTTRISLSGLDERDVARYIESIAGRAPPDALVDSIHRETEGNPLFVGELVRLLDSEGRLWEPRGDRWPIPEGVRAVIGRRLDHIPPGCREMLTLGSVIGRDFTVEALQRITDRDAENILDDLREAVAARLIGDVRDSPGRLRFSHSLIRETLYEDLMLADRVRLHRAVGEALESMYEDLESHVAELAHHFFEAAPAGDMDKAVEYAIAAGKRAVALLAYEEAVRLLAKALRALRYSPEEARRCDVLLLLGDAQGRAGDTPAAKESYLEAAEIATRLDEPALLARAAVGYSGRFPWLRAGIDRQVIPLLKQALDALGNEDSVLRVLLLSRLAGALRDQPSPEPRASIGAEAVSTARRIGDPETLTYALLAQWGAIALGPDGVEKHDAFAEELDRLADQVGDRELAMNPGWIRFIACMTRAEVGEARAQQELYARLAGELGQPSQRWYVGVMATILALQDGRFHEAERLIEDTMEAGREAQAWDAEASRLFALFILRREQGRLAEIEGELRRALITHPGYRSIRCMLLSTLCELGRIDEAWALFEQLAAGGFAAFPKDNEWLFALTLLAEAAAALEERDDALILYEQLGPYAGLVGLGASEVSTGSVTRALGLLAAVIGRPEEAARHFEDAIEQAGRMGARPWVARSKYAYAAMLAGTDRQRAIELAKSALEVCEETGMPALEERLTTLLAELGTRPRRGRAGSDGPAAAEMLTPREREVAELVAQGLSNRQIAERLYVSERTAETHVQNILMKLGFTSRAQVAGWAAREGLLDEGT